MNHYVYTLLDACGAALYVGSSGDPTMRLRRHSDRPWGDQIAEMRVVVCDSREAATSLERQMIADLTPTHNEQGNPNHRTRRYGVRQQQVLDLLAKHGPMTQVQAEHWFRDHGVDNSKSFTGTSLLRLKEKGLVEVVDRIPAYKGRWKTAAVYGAVDEVSAA